MAILATPTAELRGPDHIVAGYFLTNLLNGGTPAVTTDDDPRLSLFFLPGRGPVAGQYIGSLPGYLRGIEKSIPLDKWEQGDVVIHNHPYFGASHSPDIAIVMPEAW